MLLDGMALPVGKQIIHLNFNNMTDIKSMVDAAKQLNQAWILTSKKMEETPNDVYNAMCDVDEAVTYLIDKIGEAMKIIAISEMLKKL